MMIDHVFSNRFCYTLAAMKRHLIIGLIVAIIVAVIWRLVSPLFIDVRIDEDLTELIEQGKIRQSTMERMIETFEDIPPHEVQAIPKEKRVVIKKNLMMMAETMPNSDIQDSSMNTEENVLLQGEFRGADAFHKGSGSATVYQVGKKRILRLENFSVTNGPALSVYLTRAENGDTTKGFKTLGKLKGNIGNQNYEIPDDLNLDEFKSVLIYCVPFKVKFAIADLAAE